MKKKPNKTECIMNALKAGQKISALTAWRMCRTFTLAEIIRNEHRHRMGYRQRMPFCRVLTRKEKEQVVWHTSTALKLSVTSARIPM